MTRQSPPGQEDPGRNPEPVTAEMDQAGTPARLASRPAGLISCTHLRGHGQRRSSPGLPIGVGPSGTKPRRMNESHGTRCRRGDVNLTPGQDLSGSGPPFTPVLPLPY